MFDRNVTNTKPETKGTLQSGKTNGCFLYQEQVLKDFTEKKEPEKVNGDRKNEKNVTRCKKSP